MRLMWHLHKDRLKGTSRAKGLPLDCFHGIQLTWRCCSILPWVLESNLMMLTVQIKVVRGQVGPPHQWDLLPPRVAKAWKHNPPPSPPETQKDDNWYPYWNISYCIALLFFWRRRPLMLRTLRIDFEVDMLEIKNVIKLIHLHNKNEKKKTKKKNQDQFDMISPRRRSFWSPEAFPNQIRTWPQWWVKPMYQSFENWKKHWFTTCWKMVWSKAKETYWIHSKKSWNRGSDLIDQEPPKALWTHSTTSMSSYDAWIWGDLGWSFSGRCSPIHWSCESIRPNN